MRTRGDGRACSIAGLARRLAGCLTSSLPSAWPAFLIGLLCLGVAPVAQAQERPTAPPDTVRADTSQTDTTSTQRPDARPQQDQPFTPLPPLPPPRGRALADSLPARTPATTPIDLLERVPGSFVYDLGAVAWPHGWSRHGLAPHRWHLTLDDLPYTDPLTGRPRTDLLPPSLLQIPRIGVAPTGAPDAVHLRWREYLANVPITELRFRRDSNGLQNIEAMHSQLRRWDIGGAPGLLQITFGYAGRATAGVYDGSDVERGRVVWSRLRFRRNRWTATLTDVSARHRIGQHGGVVPPLPGTFESIYLRPLAETASAANDARHQTFRNDLTLRVRAPLLPGRRRPTTASLRWTANTFGFSTDYDADAALADTMWDVRTHSFHGAVQQPLRIGPHRLGIDLRGQWHTLARSNIASLRGSRYELHASVRDSLRLGTTRLTLHAGAHATSVQAYPSATVRAERDRIDLQVDVSGQPVPWLLADGFSTLVAPLDDPPEPVDLVGRATAGISETRGPVTMRLEAFASAIQNPIDLYHREPAASANTPPDTFAVRAINGRFYRAGATLSGTWRKTATRGLYAQWSATAQEFLNPTASVSHDRLARTLPILHGRIRLGVRLLLFQDLKTDLHLDARGWSSTNSRWFHPPTGLLTVPARTAPVPSAPGRRVGPDGTLDASAEAILRGAKLYFTFENLLSNTELQAGTFVVPVYPLPARQFRFGVHWPIFN